VAGCCECGDELSGSGATELVSKSAILLIRPSGMAPSAGSDKVMLFLQRSCRTVVNAL
jgi:hypothetical protein